MISAKSALIALLLFCASASFADVAVPPIGRVVDQTGTLSSSDVADLNEKLKAFEDRKGSQVAVLIVPTTQPETIEEYSLRVAEQWKLGRKKIDDGALLIIAKNDRKLRIEVGYGLEGVLNDATSKRIIDEVISPRFRNSDFGGGISDGVDKILSVIDGEPLPPPVWKAPEVNFSAIGDWFPFLFIGAIVLGGIFRTIFGRLLGALVAGGIVGAVVWFIVSTAILAAVAGAIVFVLTLVGDSVAGSGGSGSGGGYSSSGGSSSSSSSGGFSGGGGSFGGGGASGSW